MISLKAYLLVTISTFASLVAAVPGPGHVTGSTDVHDPTICKDSNGKYWLFSTAPGIDIRTSTDRTNWTRVGQVFPNGAATWTDAYTGTKDGNIWAISPSTGKPSGSMISLARRTTASSAVEASSIYKNGNFFYLFTSWDKCCSGTSSTYNIRVGRSSSLALLAHTLIKRELP